jgi:hypothetical protein
MSLRNDPPLRKYRHVANKQLFEELGDGLVRVTTDEGKSGVFRWNGPWVEGELTECNHNMLIFCGGPTLPKACNYRWSEVPEDVNRPSGWPEELERILHYHLG